MLNQLLQAANTYLFGPGLTAAVFLCGLYFLLSLKPFVLIKPRRTLEAFRAPAGSDGSRLNPAKAMILALAGTLGVGNIAGVTSAIALGGAGAVFWMWISVIAALPIKYAEILLAVRHRIRSPDGQWHGGAYYYIADLQGRFGKAASGAAILFAVLCSATSLSMGSAVQSNAMAASAGAVLGIPAPAAGFLIALLTLLVISGGLPRIADLTMKLVPLMSLMYIGMTLYVILTNISLLDDVLSMILADAFRAEAFAGGVLGILTSRAIRLGVTRGIVSNEAGCGTAPIAHAAADVRSPADQGVWGMFEVFIDTVVICSLTALTVLIAHLHGIPLNADGLASAMEAFIFFIPFAGPMLCIAVCFFAFGTIVCWYYYGAESLNYLLRRVPVRIHRILRRIYLFLYAACAALGALTSEGIVWSFADFTVAAMTAVNIIALLLHQKEIRAETKHTFG